MRLFGLLSIAFILVTAIVAIPAGRVYAAQDASPVTAGTGGALYTFDSGPDGFNTKTFFYDTGSEVVAFDAQFTPELAEKAIAYLQTESENPITYVVVTHPNPDKFNGISAFQDAGAEVITSEATAAAMPGVQDYKKAFFVGNGMFTDETYPELGTVDETFSDTMTLELSDGKTVELSELSEPGVSSTQTVAFIPEMNALIVGDLVHHTMHAWLEGGIVDGQATPTLDGWIADLRELESTFGADPEPTVYGGRGDPAPLSEAVAAQIAYLEQADQIVTDYLAGLGDRTSELTGEKAGEHYAAIQTEIADAFPGYEFADMIGFSVYGLVNSKL
ncbi:MAG: MBL fold metallo-hydrolase [Chloroflexia bacterium]|nr:MBL fold metallo-hydrolase [Chloroflexia bacterium]